MVLSLPGDPGLPRLAEVPAGVAVDVVHTPEDALRRAPEADVVLSASDGGRLLRAAWPGLSRVRWIHSRSAGVEHLVFDALAESGVPMTNSRGVFGPALGEFAATAVLFFAKELRRMLRNQAERRWEAIEVEMAAGRTAAIVGFGDVGRACADSLRRLGLRIVGLRRHPAPDPLADEVVGEEALPRVLAACDVCVIATPLTPKTRGLLGAREIALLRPHAVLVNVGRGPVVDEDALVDALRRRAIRGAALDVFREEPLPAKSALWELDNVLVSPHTADRVRGWEQNAMGPFLDNLRRFLAGEPLLFRVDARAGY
jgi:phosphoglycerate dehydrogenase-like enzyme